MDTVNSFFSVKNKQKSIVHVALSVFKESVNPSKWKQKKLNIESVKNKLLNIYCLGGKV